MVRVGDPRNMIPAVSGHRWLTLDKAAATLTNREERLAQILVALESLRGDPRLC